MGWQPFFQQQLSLEEWETYTPARIIRPQRSELIALTPSGEQSVLITSAMPALTVGDWILLNQEHAFVRLLDRSSLFSRKAAGSKVNEQYIAANVDTVFVVCSLNQNFNLNRIERYLALTNDAGVEPVVVLTKADRCEDPLAYQAQAQALNPLLMVIAVNGLDSNSVEQLKPWCKEGKTVAFLGSSGVGKSTLINTLSVRPLQATGSIREDDSKGRHTTTGRTLHITPGGGLLLDTPGMRELQLTDCEQGIENIFSDISELAKECQFSDCQHQSEPGCAVLAAIDTGKLEARRLQNYLTLMQEQALNTATLAEKRSKDRNLSRYYRSVQKETRQRKKR
jgi:ribosome biogenesis GTPase / thiamine phosphate phosphatase